MLFELLAVVSAGFAGAGIALLARRLVRSAPRWLVPVAAGSAMIALAVSLEYTWFARTRAALPERVEVALAHEARAPWRPWTYVVPFVDRFVAVDRGSVMTHEAVADQRIVDLLIFGRWAPTTRVRSVFDCAAGRRADLVEGVSFGRDGTIDGATWHDMGLADPLVRAACAERAKT